MDEDETVQEDNLYNHEYENPSKRFRISSSSSNSQQHASDFPILSPASAAVATTSLFDAGETVQKGNPYNHEYENLSKRSRISSSSNNQQHGSDFPILAPALASFATTPLSDSGETVAERNDTNIVCHVVSHEKISNNTNRHVSSSAPFATDFNSMDNSGNGSVGRLQNHPISSIHPVLPPSSWLEKNDSSPAVVTSSVGEYGVVGASSRSTDPCIIVVDTDVEGDFYDAPPDPETVVLSNAVKKKVLD